MKTKIFDWSGIDRLYCAFEDGVLEPPKPFNDGRRSSYVCPLSTSVGEGYFEYFVFGDDFNVCIFNCKWSHSQHFKVVDHGRIRLNFSLELHMVMEFDDCDAIDATRPSFRLIKNEPEQVSRETISENSRTIWVTLVFTPEYLIKLYGEQAFVDNEEFTNLMLTETAVSIYREYPLDHTFKQIVSTMIASQMQPELHLAYIEHKAQELLCASMNYILESHNRKNLTVTLRPRDQKAINLAHDMLLSNLEQPPTIREICLMIGINRNKLRYGFKQLYGRSPSKVLQDERLAEAYRQLLMTDDDIINIAMNVGFTHQSSFSTAFGKKFGCTPTEARKSNAVIAAD